MREDDICSNDYEKKLYNENQNGSRMYTPQGVEIDIQMDTCGLQMPND